MLHSQAQAIVVEMRSLYKKSAGYAVFSARLPIKRLLCYSLDSLKEGEKRMTQEENIEEKNEKKRGKKILGTGAGAP
jgi:hypothetical protein